MIMMCQCLSESTFSKTDYTVLRHKYTINNTFTNNITVKKISTQLWFTYCIPWSSLQRTRMSGSIQATVPNTACKMGGHTNIVKNLIRFKITYLIRFKIIYLNMYMHHFKSNLRNTSIWLMVLTKIITYSHLWYAFKMN